MKINSVPVLLANKVDVPTIQLVLAAVPNNILQMSVGAMTMEVVVFCKVIVKA
tara:strand:- start:117 stop:275 length:159 start_codon:yes stop_codon:yes gene_type:complete